MPSMISYATYVASSFTCIVALKVFMNKLELPFINKMITNNMCEISYKKTFDEIAVLRFNKETGEIKYIYVDPIHRRLGYATSMLEEARKENKNLYIDTNKSFESKFFTNGKLNKF